MKKTTPWTKKNSYQVVAATILEEEKELQFVFDLKECQQLAKRFDLPDVLSFQAKVSLFRDEFVHVKGEFSAQVIYQSVISLEDFPSVLSEKFEVLFSENPPTDSDEIIDPIERGRIDLKEVLFEQFGLALDPFPKKEEEKGEFIYQDESQDVENPFSELKNLIKK